MPGPWDDFKSTPAQPAAEPDGPWKQYKPLTERKGLAPQPQGPTPPGTPSNPIRIQSMASRALGAVEGAGKQAFDWYEKQPSWATKAGEQVQKDFAAYDKGGVKGLMKESTDPTMDLLGGFAAGGAIGEIKPPSLKPALDALKVHLSPDTLSPEGEAAGGAIREAQGTRFRDTASTAAALEPFHKVVNALPEPARMAFIDHVEGGNVQPMSGPLTDLAKVLRGEMQKREAKLSALPGKEKMEFVKDYLAHFWQDPKAAEKIAGAGGGQGKQGSAASLKKRVIPTYAAGIAAGLKPLTSDPIEITMRYVRSMDRYIAAQEVLEAAKANGDIKYFKPTVQGASGHPDSFSHNVAPSGPIPEGWVPITGRGATNALGQTAYAHPDFARVYNNFVSRGFHDISEDLGNAVDKLQHASNAITGLELGVSGYHALNVATSAVISDVGRSISNIVGGHPLKGLTAMGRAFTAPVTSYLRGRKLEQVYLGRSQGTPDWRKVIDIATKAGSRGVGKRHASDYEFSAMGSYWTSLKRGAFKQEMAQSWQNVKDRPIRGGAGELFHLVGRAMETISKPLFEDYIPRVKNAALYDLIKDWVEANPQATAEEQVRVARKMVDAMDDRFGEMIQDNLFVNKALKQSAQIGMRSYSWTLGLFRQLARTAGDPRRLSIKHPDYNPALAATLAGAITISLINLSYFYLKQLGSILAGNPPKEPDLRDAMAPRTGGQVPGFAGRQQVPERAMLPSHERDIFGWWYDPKQEATNKQARFMEMIEEGVSGKDWAGRPYMDPDASTEMQVMQWLEHLGSALVPISVGTLEQGHKKGSTLGTGAAVSGVREAPKYLEDPEGYKRGMTIIHRNAYKRGQKSIRKQDSQYQGAQE